MGTVVDKLDKLADTKQRLRDALIAKGQAVSDDDPFSSYPDKLLSIDSSPVVVTPLDPLEVYKNTRPSDWIPMPEPNDNEIYLLFFIPKNASSLLAFTVYCTGSYKVEARAISYLDFIDPDTDAVSREKMVYWENLGTYANETKFEAELDSYTYRDNEVTSDGFIQVLICVSGTDITQWLPSNHSRYSINTNGEKNWNIFEISCKLSKGTLMRVGSNGLYNLRYFSWIGENALTNADKMFQNCQSLIAVTHLDTSNVTVTSNMFNGCAALVAIPKFDTRKVTAAGNMFTRCYAMRSVPTMDLSNATSVSQIFMDCYSLLQCPSLNTKKAGDMYGIFTNCNSLLSVLELNALSAADMGYAFSLAHSIEWVTFASGITGWEGTDISFTNCRLSHKALQALFQSLPEVSIRRTLDITGNPGTSEVTFEDYVNIDEKGWDLIPEVSGELEVE